MKSELIWDPQICSQMVRSEGSLGTPELANGVRSECKIAEGSVPVKSG